MVTFLFTIQISQAEKYQCRFAASVSAGYETIMIFAETRWVNHDCFITSKKKK
jgi:hypothetical protein